MSEIERLNELLAKAYAGPAWHGPSVKEALAGVDARRAAARPIAEAHSIWELVHHIAVWDEVVRRRLLGEKVEEPVDGNFPASVEATDAAWTALLERLERANAALRAAVATVSQEDLASPPPNNTTPRWEAIHGIVDHELYHAGQIALLAKSASSGRSTAR